MIIFHELNDLFHRHLILKIQLTEQRLFSLPIINHLAGLYLLYLAASIRLGSPALLRYLFICVSVFVVVKK